MDRCTPRSARMSFLVEKNLRCLRQIVESLEQHERAELAEIGSVAHYYRCFLDGLSLCHLDYRCVDDHGPDLTRVSALGLMRSLVGDFETSTELNYDGIVWVRLDAAESCGIRECFMESCVSRELQILFDRTVLLLGARMGGDRQFKIREIA